MAEFEYAETEKLRFVEDEVYDFLFRVLGKEPLIVSDESALSNFHDFDGYETIDDLLGATTYNNKGSEWIAEHEAQMRRDFVPYSEWVREVKRRTQMMYGVAFEEDNPHLWEIGYKIAEATNKSSDEATDEHPLPLFEPQTD